MAGDMHDMWGAMCGGGEHAGQGVRGRGGVNGRRDGHCSERYASCWSAFLFSNMSSTQFSDLSKYW